MHVNKGHWSLDIDRYSSTLYPMDETTSQSTQGQTTDIMTNYPPSNGYEYVGSTSITYSTYRYVHHPIDSVTTHHSHAKIRVTRNLSCLLYTFRGYFTLPPSLFLLFESTLHSVDHYFCSASGIVEMEILQNCAY